MLVWPLFAPEVWHGKVGGVGCYVLMSTLSNPFVVPFDTDTLNAWHMKRWLLCFLLECVSLRVIK